MAAARGCYHGAGLLVGLGVGWSKVLGNFYC